MMSFIINNYGYVALSSLACCMVVANCCFSPSASGIFAYLFLHFSYTLYFYLPRGLYRAKILPVFTKSGINYCVKLTALA